MHGLEVSSRSIGLSPAIQAGGDAFRWYGSTDMDLRAPLKRTKHPLSLSTMLKPGGYWRRSVGTRYAHSIES